jgi:hypothetical protein
VRAGRAPAISGAATPAAPPPAQPREQRQRRIDEPAREARAVRHPADRDRPGDLSEREDRRERADALRPALRRQVVTHERGRRRDRRQERRAEQHARRERGCRMNEQRGHQRRHAEQRIEHRERLAAAHPVEQRRP